MVPTFVHRELNSKFCTGYGLKILSCKLNLDTEKLHTVKGKAVPLQVWSGPEGSRKLRFPDFMTMAQDGGKVVSCLYPQEMLLVLIYVRG